MEKHKFYKCVSMSFDNFCPFKNLFGFSLSLLCKTVPLEFLRKAKLINMGFDISFLKVDFRERGYPLFSPIDPITMYYNTVAPDNIKTTYNCFMP